MPQSPPRSKAMISTHAHVSLRFLGTSLAAASVNQFDISFIKSQPEAPAFNSSSLVFFESVLGGACEEIDELLPSMGELDDVEIVRSW